MYSIATLAAALTLGCATPPAHGADAAPGAALELPPARTPLELPAEGDLSLADLLDALAESTGLRIVVDEGGRQFLQSSPVAPSARADVPAAEAYAYVEAILAHHDVYIGLLKGGEIPVLGVYTPAGRRAPPRAGFMLVKQADLPRFADHPALLIQTTVHLPGTDVRQLSTSLRGLLTDTHTQTLLATGDHGLLLRGPGAFVADIVEMIEELDRIEREERKEREARARESAEEETPEEG